MGDLVYIALIIGFFALASGLVRLCDRIIGPDELHDELPDELPGESMNAGATIGLEVVAS